VTLERHRHEMEDERDVDLDLQSAPRIGVDLHVLDGKFQGSRTHCIEIFSRVPALLPEMKFLFLGDIPRWAPGLAERFSSANTELVQMPSTSSIQRLGLQLPLITFRHRLDLLHTQYVSPLISRCATAVTIHDILFETHPQFFTPFFNFRSRVLFRRAARRSKRVFTVSAFSRDELVRCYGVSPEKIILIKNAADTNKFYAGDAGADKLASLQLVRDGYFLSVGRLEPRKNYPRLIRAYAKLPADAPKLVIVGQKDFGFDEIFHVSQECRLGNRLQILENVSDEMLGPLYRNARAMVYPSLAEGFGMPIVEAMASHVPVLTSYGTALSETGGDAALLVDATSENQIVNGLTRLLYDDDLLRELRAKSAARAREFRWEASAAAVASAYRTLFQPPLRAAH
jgi:glycosyltransferase involved in cell wall biosynthesis